MEPGEAWTQWQLAATVASFFYLYHSHAKGGVMFGMGFDVQST